MVVVSPTLFSQLRGESTVIKSTRKLQSVNPGWFYIRFLTMVNSSYLNSFKDLDIYLNLSNRMETGWYKYYLNANQVDVMNKNQNLKLYPVKKTVHNIRSLHEHIEHQKYLVETTPDFVAEHNQYKITQLARSFYIFSGNVNLQEVYNDDRVASIRKFPSRKILNRYTSGYVQTGDKNITFENDAITYDRLLHRKGLNGKGQLISVFDTGVDYLNPFFYDPNADVPITTPSDKHRKIYQIVPCADSEDVNHGHGTHVSGTALGEAYCGPECGLSLYNGVATKSKLVMYDLGFVHEGNSMNGDFDLVNSSNDLMSIGCYISSNSWGADTDCEQVTWGYDVIAYYYPELLFVFSAGNSGAEHDLSCPSDSKNVLSVGALDRLRLSDIQYNDNIKVESGDVSVDASEAVGSMKVLQSGINSGSRYRIHNRATTTNNEDCEDKVFIARQPTCDDIKKAVNNKAVAIIMQSTPLCSDALRNLIALAVTQSNFEKVKDFKTVTITGRPSNMNKQVKASFSSYGPSDYSLTKPDIVVPGSTVYSADGVRRYSSTTPSAPTDAALTTKSGTSMAAPAASGMAAIIRQFFHDKFYPYFEPRDDGISMNVTSYFQRAAFITMARALPDSNEKTPSTSTGYGSPTLDNLLAGIYGLRVADKQTIYPQKRVAYQIKTNSTKAPLVITMAYLDNAFDFSVKRSLTADLDLVVVSPSGKHYRGNGKADQLNTNERVYISENEVEEGVYKINILANNFTVDEENTNTSFALVVTGPFKQDDFNANPIFLEKIDNGGDINCEHGKFDGNICQCDGMYTGLQCNYKFTKVEANKDLSVTATHYNINYFMVEIKDVQAGFVPRLNVWSGSYARNISVALSNERFSDLFDDGVLHTVIRRSGSLDLTVDEFKGNCYFAIYSSYKNLNINYRISLEIPTPKPTNAPTLPRQSPRPTSVKTNSGGTTINNNDLDEEETKVITPTIIALASLLILTVAVIIILLLLPGTCKCIKAGDESMVKRFLKNSRKLDQLQAKLNANNNGDVPVDAEDATITDL